MLYRLRFNTYESAFKDLTEVQWQEMRAHIPSLPAVKPDNSWMLNEFTCDTAGMREIARLKLGIQFCDDRASESLMYVRLQDRIEQLEVRRDDTAAQIIHGAGVHIHIPDLALMFICEVMHLDDCCTDNLQSHLDEGWRILAVCPPNAKRRPDYILGRSKERI